MFSLSNNTRNTCILRIYFVSLYCLRIGGNLRKTPERKDIGKAETFLWNRHKLDFSSQVAVFSFHIMPILRFSGFSIYVVTYTEKF